MSADLLPLFVTISGSLISGLLAMNLFFFRDFMKRIEKSIDGLTNSISHHGEKLTEVDKNFTEKISRLDERIEDFDRLRKRSPRP